MDQSGDRLFIYHTDPQMDRIFEGKKGLKPWSRHFSQNEDFFILLSDELEVPSLPIHHDIKIKHPSVQYESKIQTILRQLAVQIPDFFSGMHWYFDATETLCLDFFQLLRIEEINYLCLLRIDLGFRPNYAVVLAPGTNDETPCYRSRQLFIEADIIPLREAKQLEHGQFQFQFLQTVSETWIGETGRGYFVQGIWLDRELTKFFTKLFIPAGKRLYPYYPLNCKFRCICFQPYDFTSDSRRKSAIMLHRCRIVLEKNIRSIESSLKNGSFSEELTFFIELRQTIADQLIAFFQPISIQSYLNPDEFKEYELIYAEK